MTVFSYLNFTFAFLSAGLKIFSRYITVDC